MKRAAMKLALHRQNERKTPLKQQRTLATERAKVKLPFKSDHVTLEELRQGMAKLLA